MNPLDMRGPQFLQFFAAVFIGAIALLIVIRQAIRRSGQSLRVPQLDLYELAYLAGGQVRAIQAALVALASRRAILAGKRGAFTAIGGAPRATEPMEATLQQAIVEIPNCNFPKMIARCRPELDALDDRLSGAGVLVPKPTRTLVALLSFGLLFAVVMLGVAKIFVGIDRHKPVGFLIFACIFGFIVACVMAMNTPRLTLAGKAALEDWKRRHVPTTSPMAPGIPDMSLLMGVALFGPTLLAGTALAEFQQPLMHVFSSSSGVGSSGSSCGGSSCSGGDSSCGGGGCGGFGGGGD
jgi:uncharacterized protein (TIGR04222 family)